MPRMDNCVVAERKEDLCDRSHQHVVIAARQIGAADRASKQRVADEELLGRFATAADLETDTAGTVSGRVVYVHGIVAEGDGRAVVKEIDRRRLAHREAEHRALLNGTLVEKEIVLMQ